MPITNIQGQFGKWFINLSLDRIIQVLRVLEYDSHRFPIT